MELRQLRYFLAVAGELHFARAAERLLIAPPSLSQQIKALERQLNVQLFLRSSTGVSLTEAGTALVPLAAATVASADEVLLTAARMSAGQTGLLRVGFQPFAFTGVVRELLSAFALREPTVELQLKQFEWDDPAAGVLDDQVDIAVVRPPFRGADRLRLLELHREPVLLVMREGHALARLSSVGLEQVAAQPFLQSPRVVDPIFAAYWYLRDIRTTLPVTSHATTVEEWLAEITLGRGVSLIPAGFADEYRRSGLSFVRVDGIANSATALAWKPSSTNAPGRRLAQFAARAVPG
jgi:DNA-binding transcriptional LysR family regulator